MLVSFRYFWKALGASLFFAPESARGFASGAPKVGDLVETPVSSEVDQGRQVLNTGWAAVNNCAIPRGYDVLDSPKRVSLREAHDLCSATKDCVAFTFEGNDPGMQLLLGAAVDSEDKPEKTEQRLWVHFKSRFKCVKASWTSYQKVPPGKQLEKSSLPLPLGQESLVPALASVSEGDSTTTTTTTQPAIATVSQTTTATTISEAESTRTAAIQIKEQDLETDSAPQPHVKIISDPLLTDNTATSVIQNIEASASQEAALEAMTTTNSTANTSTDTAIFPSMSLESMPTTAHVNEMDTNVDQDGNGVALCLLGHPGVLEHTHKSLTANLLAPLGHPDVFIHTLQEAGLRDLYSLRNHVVNSSGLPEDVYSAFVHSTVDGITHLTSTYRGIGGNWLGAECLDPVIQDEARLRPGSALCIYHGQRQCLSMIAAKEALREGPYASVVVSRLDFQWLAPHPPLKLLSSNEVWIPSGSDWSGGVNIRHAVLPRDKASAYLSDGFDMVVQGTAAQTMAAAFGSNKVFGYPGLNIERYLKARLLHRNFTIQRFPNVAYIACTQRQQWRAKSRGGVPQCFGTMGRDAPGWLFRDEQGHAARVAACVRSSWNARKLSLCTDDVSHLYPDV
eukprot:gnl/MRDRNA2_/MRDRNA2_29032_c0_seq1.p1 gnl/MRDRNA2_/MRDRNA2_29032_c0~~gnl/MRDRNA2_/MRDRNA2_29032_c0_seq1.p1  ORF type:complete len:621 (+),score=108.01 gnl/MRDRNA2_/MRDRNA2_29032_c0_seq1:107-1969(+)